MVDVDRYSLYLFVPLRRHLHCHCHCHRHRRRRHSTLIIDGREEQCSQYFSSGTGISEFYIMWRPYVEISKGGLFRRPCQVSSSFTPHTRVSDPPQFSAVCACRSVSMAACGRRDVCCLHRAAGV